MLTKLSLKSCQYAITKAVMACTSILEDCINKNRHERDVVLKHFKVPWTRIQSLSVFKFKFEKDLYKSKYMNKFISKFPTELQFLNLEYDQYSCNSRTMSISPMFPNLLKQLCKVKNIIKLNNIALGYKQFALLISKNPYISRFIFENCKISKGTIKTTLKGQSNLKRLEFSSDRYRNDITIRGKEYAENILENVLQCPCVKSLEQISFTLIGFKPPDAKKAKQKYGLEGIRLYIDNKGGVRVF
ncbi:unnamed protein product [Moneuplotes crassus]|uniref:Uncharacterized protein n=1 Tax=Euplotes crassus TaxID=5936 RepID=A0AAD1XQ36_EUPCR|nr:unnamed protein product [Moneuplotes crassus]